MIMFLIGFKRFYRLQWVNMVLVVDWLQSSRLVGWLSDGTGHRKDGQITAVTEQLRHRLLHGWSYTAYFSV